MIDSTKIREDFPILHQKINGNPFVYFDNASTSQKPKVVVEAITDYYYRYNANVHRGLYKISAMATEAYDNARKKVADFIGAAPQEVIFTSGTTASINLVANSWGQENLKENDIVVLSEMEHHSNIVPWHLLQKRLGFKIHFLQVDEDGSLQLDDLAEKCKGAKLVSITHVSNTLGTVNPVEEIVKTAHANGAKVLIDGAQAVPHMAIDVKKIGCDFYAFSGHKMCGPTGVGILWGREQLLESMPPFLGGGSMIDEVHLDYSTYAQLPNKFEAGTMNIAQAIGLGVAVDYLQEIGLDNITAHEQQLTEVALEKLKSLDVQIIGNAQNRVGVISFAMNRIHPHDISTILDHEGVAIRAGHHCTQLLMRKFAVPATTRASFYFYNTIEEIDQFVKGLQKVKEMFRRVS
ncbi:cysteine desulfurase [Candidatus Uabimicrobium amorphum]|uniref:Cysteine desulfurase n=1 Tax=Uabimicrobium amorphum TaxID=2596890 RepID=A0A5S9IL58_UABAM|nr:cysteine desulfurase [Candidatus Uabimicrobium amorphum]BBM83893.1 cysteine desulfurase [Candidatus Uabimicrobium amorphum]